MNRLIIVSPHFPPTNAPDHQRVRMALPYFREFGWDPEVLAVDSRDVAAPQDPFLERTYPADIPVTRVRVPAGGWTRLPGMGNLGYRCRPAVTRALADALAHPRSPQPEARKTLVYFSTTQFPVHGAILTVKPRPPTAVAMDFQDPWVNNYYRDHPTIRPPGGRLKYGVDRWLAQRLERRVVPRLHGITVVSDRYAADLRSRYPAWSGERILTLPFGGAQSDFAAVRHNGIEQTHFDPADGNRHWVYVGRGGADMAKAVRALFRALKIALTTEPALANVRLHFLGTDYAAGPRARCTISPIAQQEGVGELVIEKPHRIPYSETLKCLLDAHALLVPGSDDPGYTASKIYPYLLAGKPLLAVFAATSSVNRVLEESQAGCSVPFSPTDSVDDLAAAIGKRWFSAHSYEQPRAPHTAELESYTAREMTRKLTRYFDDLPIFSSPR